MKLGSSPSLHLPRPNVKLLRTPNAVKVPRAGMVKASVYKSKTSAGGWAAKVLHHLTDGSTQQFNFTDPMKFGQHLTKLTRGQWRHPMKNEAGAIGKELDFG